MRLPEEENPPTSMVFVSSQSQIFVPSNTTQVIDVCRNTSASEVHARITQVYRGTIHACQREWMPTQDFERFSFQLGPGGGIMVGTCQIYL